MVSNGQSMVPVSCGDHTVTAEVVSEAGFAYSVYTCPEVSAVL